MDRGERRRRNEIFIARNKRLLKDLQLVDWLKNLVWYNRRKVRPFTCSHCSKKTKGRPKHARGACGCGMDRSPKIGRNRWRLDLDLFE